MRIWFQAPQFDASGKLMAKPKVLRVMLNGVPVQENFTVPGPTLSYTEIQPAAGNPIMLQGDHGPVAYRNIYIKPLEQKFLDGTQIFREEAWRHGASRCLRRRTIRRIWQPAGCRSRAAPMAR